MRRRLTVRRWTALAACVAAGALAAGPAQAGTPPNDHFADATPIVRAAGDVRALNVNATKEPGEPNHADNQGGRSVWYRWIAPASGQFAFVTFGSDFDTLLAVYTGTSVDALTRVAASEDAGEGTRQSAVSFRAAVGAEYRIAVDGFGGKVGRIRLRWMQGPENDNFADAAALPAGYGRAQLTTVGATWELGEPIPAEQPEDEYTTDGASVWFRWTATETGPVSFATEATTVDTVLAVFTGDDLHALDLVTTNDDDPLFGCCESRATFTATAGTSYAILVDSIYGWGASTLVWRRVLLGTRGVDSIAGSSADEEIHGLAGADRIRAGGGDDLVLAGDGADLVVGGAGNDRIFGDRGADTVADRAGRDALHGDAGRDRLDAFDRTGDDTVDGGAHGDRCRADRSDRRSGCP